jgi:TldD protein
MPNISMVPGETPMNLEGLLAGVKRGIYIKGRGSWSIDQQRYNFQFGGQLFYEIRDGRLGDMLRDVAYQARAPDFWSAMDAIGDRSTYFLDGTPNCGKGQPSQAAPVGHGAVPARFRDINVLNTERQDI